MLLSLAAFWAGEYRRGVDLAAQAAAALDDPEETLWHGMAVYAGGLNQGLLGDFAAVLTTAAELRRIGERAGDRRLESWAHHLVGWIAVMRGDAATAVTACARAVEIAPDPLTASVTLHHMGEARLVAGDPGGAGRDLERALTLERQFGLARLECLTMGDLGEVKLLLGDIGAARGTAREALALAEAHAFAWGRGRAHRVLGRAARAAGEDDRAAQHFRESLDTFARLPAPWEMTCTARFMGDVPAAT
jgi:tetratricopeptide (TPR) repeat protein